MAIKPTTWNPSDGDEGGTLSNGNLTYSSSVGGIRSVFGATSGKYYWETTAESPGTVMIGVATAAANLSFYPGSDSNGWAVYFTSGEVYSAGVVVDTLTGGELSAGQVLSVLLDATAKELRFWVDGTDGGVVISLTGSQFFAAVGYSGTTTTNFGATAFSHTPPAGYGSGLGPEVDILEVGGFASFATGTPVALRRSVIAQGVTCFNAGTPVAVYDEVIEPAGALCFAAGAPDAAYDELVEPVGVSSFAAGTPTAKLEFTVQAQGVLLFAAGAPAASLETKVAVPGGLAFVAGAPLIVADQTTTSTTVMVPSGVAFRDGAVSVETSTALAIPGVVAAIVGVPGVVSRAHQQSPVPAFVGGTLTASSTVRPQGRAAFSTGVHKIRGTSVVASAVLARAGVPTVRSIARVSLPAGTLQFAPGTHAVRTAATVRHAPIFAAGAPAVAGGSTC